MKKLVLFFAVIFFISSLSVIAKPDTLRVGTNVYQFVKADTTSSTMVVPDHTGGIYVVKKGDCLWTLSGKFLNDPLRWREVYNANPFLLRPGRLFYRNGLIIVLIKPGEQLKGLEKVGWKIERVMVINNYYVRSNDFPWWVLLLLLGFGLALLLWYLYQRSPRALPAARTTSAPTSPTSQPGVGTIKNPVVIKPATKDSVVASAETPKVETEAGEPVITETDKPEFNNATSTERIYHIDGKEYRVPKDGCIEIVTERIILR